MTEVRIGAETSSPSQSGGGTIASHGGVELTQQEVSGISVPGEAAVKILEGPADSGKVFAWMTHPAQDAKNLAGPEEAPEPSTVDGLADLPQTPASDDNWEGPIARSSFYPADPQIAVSRTHVVATTNDTLAIYDKNRKNLLQILDPQRFFLDLRLGLPESIDRAFDVRAIFDPYRNRFWLGALVRNSPQGNENATTKFVAAVSKSENPLDGWFLYWWDAVAHDGVTNDPVFQPGDDGDFPSLGIDSTAIYQTNAVNNSERRRYWHVVFFPADTLANGQTAGGWQYWDLSNPDGQVTGEVIQPVVHHDSSPSAFFASRYYAGGNKILVWALSDALQSTQRIERAEVSLNPFGSPGFAPQAGTSQRIQMDNLGSNVLKAVYRSGQLYLVTNDAYDWFHDGQALNSIRLVRLDVSDFPNIPTQKPVFIDRQIGSNSSFTDQPTDRMYYGWPAVEVNRFGDIVMVYARTGSTIFPEVRVNAFLATESDVRPSRLLKAGEAPYALDYPDQTSANALRWGDTAGACVDPSDDTAIWVTHAFATQSRALHINNWALWVGKLLTGTFVPECRGLPLGSARTIIKEAGLLVGKVITLPPEEGPGRLGPLLVVIQSPAAGTKVARNTRVDLTQQRERYELPRG